MSHVHGLDEYSRLLYHIVDPHKVMNRGPKIRVILNETNT